MSLVQEGERAYDTEPLLDGIVIRLPIRRLPQTGCLTFFMMAFGAVFVCGPLFGSATIDSPIALLFAMPFVLVGVLIMMLGFAIRLGRSELRVERGELLAIERAGAFHWTRRRALADAKALRIHEANFVIDGRRVDGFGRLVIEFANGKPFACAHFYAIDLLQQIATELGPHVGVDVDAQPVEVVEAAVEAVRVPDEKALVQPESSRATLEHNAAGLLLTLPPAGLVRGSKGLFVFAIIWTGITLLMSIAMLAGGVGIPALMLIPFWLVGILMLTFSINMGRRHALVGVVQDSLIVKRTNLFGTKTHEWPQAAIESISVGPSTMSVNDVRVPQLQIKANGEHLGLWTGRDEQELHWIAAVLNDGMGGRG